mmetsp:Transcript_61595/g.107100  ORF Transcript_61595/g.107100 Transcript_61595/m.107100 type:complete len:136 (-) Transcript_61595:223-630(-)
MKPDWDKLIGDFAESPTSLVADVDCTTDGGKDLCEKHGVRGYPTIKYGDPSDLKDYNGGRSYDALKKFADENLGPTCGPANMDLCDDETKVKIEKYLKMSIDKLVGKSRMAVKTLEEDVPLMKKVLASMKPKEEL